jgi:hypothetical protein
VVKPFLIESINNVESTDENVQSTSEDVHSPDHQSNLSAEPPEITSPPANTRPTRTRRLPLRY